MSYLKNAQKYPPSTRIVLERMPPMATQILNRWMRLWPERTQRLVEKGELLGALALEMLQVQELQRRKSLPGSAAMRVRVSMLRPPPLPKMH